MMFKTLSKFNVGKQYLGWAFNTKLVHEQYKCALLISALLTKKLFVLFLYKILLVHCQSSDQLVAKCYALMGIGMNLAVQNNNIRTCRKSSHSHGSESYCSSSSARENHDTPLTSDKKPVMI